MEIKVYVSLDNYNRLKNGMSEDGTMNMLYQWKSRGYILQLTVDSFKKLK